MTSYWFISIKYRRHALLALMTSALALAVILLGAYTRLTDAGLSCPDWPHCYGYVTAPHTAAQLLEAAKTYPTLPVNISKAWTEMTHRYFAGTEGLLILILSFSILRSKKLTGFKPIVISFVLIGLLALQIPLGMLTVTEKLRPVIVLSHLLTGLSLLSVLWWAYLDLHWRHDFSIQKSNVTGKIWLWLGLIIAILQITLGGWVSTHYAGLACVDFPYCNGQVMPALQLHLFNSDLITIHMLHRLGALITAIYIGLLSGWLLLTKPSFRTMGLCLLGLLVLQISLGILNIMWLRPVWIALIHHAVAILLLLTLITTLSKAYFESRST